jgi:hypothetical protein
MGVETMKLAFPCLLGASGGSDCGSKPATDSGQSLVSIVIGWRESEKRFRDIADH